MRNYDRQEDLLWKAAFDGNATKVKTLVRKFEPSKNRELFRDVLLCAVQKGHAQVVKVLLAAGGNVEQVDASGIGTLLMHAAWDGHLNVVRVLVAGGATVDRKFEGRTALEAALENGHLEVADYLKKQGADWPMLTMLYACQRGDLAEVKKAIAAGARIDRGYGAFKATPLMRAAAAGRIEVVRFLLKQRVDPRVRVKGETALWSAAATGRSVEVIDALVEAGADVNDESDSVTALMVAAHFGRLPVVKRLVELGADVAAVDRTGVDSAMDYARKGKNPEVIAYLTKLGARSARDPVLETARAIAREFGGKSVPVFDGFLITSRLAGFRCEFRIGRSTGSVEVSNLEFFDPGFRAAENAELIIGQKPSEWHGLGTVRAAWRGNLRKVKAIEKSLGLPVYRSIGDGAIQADAALQFVSRHRRALRQLALSTTEEVWLGATFIQFTWAVSEFQRLRVRLQKFGALVRAVARQKHPSSNRDLDD